MIYRATTAQRHLIQMLLKKVELDTKRLTLMHQPVFMKAGLWSSADENLPLDHIINNFTKGEASRLISSLQEQLA